MKIRVIECWKGGRHVQTECTWASFASYCQEILAPETLDRMKLEIETTGSSRQDGENYWFEYERIDE